MAVSREGMLVWRGKFIEWKYEGFVSKNNLTFLPHFTLTVTDKDKNQSITFPDIRLKDKKLQEIKDLLKLPTKEQEGILNSAVDALEAEYARR